MRFIPTVDADVERLKKQAKKLQRKGGGKHAELLDRVARGAGYDHWHHVVLCHKEANTPSGPEALKHEIARIRLAERRGEVRVIMTGPEVLKVPLVLFSTGLGDCWVLEPDDGQAACVMWQGTDIDLVWHDLGKYIEIDWSASYELLGHFFKVSSSHAGIGERAIGGYPLQPVREVLDRAQDIRTRLAAVIGQEDAIELTDQVIADLVRQGWPESDLRNMATDGFRYSPARNSVLSPLEFSEDWEEGDSGPAADKQSG